MNKYVVAFEKVKEACVSFDTVDELITLKELVEKATPKDVERTEVNELGYTHECPGCGSYVGTICDGIVHEDKYCCLCGQRLWWGEEE